MLNHLFQARLGITGEEKELLYRFLRDKIGREGIRALAIIWFDEGKTEAQIADLLLGLHDGERTGRPRKANENVEKTVEDLMKKKPEKVGYKSGFWISGLLCLHLFTIPGFLLSDNTVRRVLHRLGYVFRRPKLWSGPSGEKPPEIEKALKEVKKRKQNSYIKMKRASISCQH